MRGSILVAVSATFMCALISSLFYQDMGLFLMSLVALSLGVAGVRAAYDQDDYDHDLAIHIHDWTVRQSWVNEGKYVDGFYNEMKYVGYNNNEAHRLMQEEIKARNLELGDLFKPFDGKTTKITRVLMTTVWGAK